MGFRACLRDIRNCFGSQGNRILVDRHESTCAPCVEDPTVMRREAPSPWLEWCKPDASEMACRAARCLGVREDGKISPIACGGGARGSRSGSCRDGGASLRGLIKGQA